jgi:hypothetical protein
MAFALTLMAFRHGTLCGFIVTERAQQHHVFWTVVWVVCILDNVMILIDG